jgi:hypothetical protein
MPSNSHLRSGVHFTSRMYTFGCGVAIHINPPWKPLVEGFETNERGKVGERKEGWGEYLGVRWEKKEGCLFAASRLPTTLLPKREISYVVRKIKISAQLCVIPAYVVEGALCLSGRGAVKKREVAR